MAKQARLHDDETFEHKGYTFRVRLMPDQDSGTPWENGDGHGPVSKWTTRDKAPGERLLMSDRRRMARFYDVQAATKLARKDSWGCKHSKHENGKFISGHATKGEAIACAVEQDYDYLRRWCNDQWCYVGVVVDLIEDEDDDAPRYAGDKPMVLETESVWGIESDATDYLTETAYKLADEILSRVEVATPDAMVSEN